jgi:hypothetical protein
MPARLQTRRQRIGAGFVRRRDGAFLRSGFLDLGGERHVLRALRELAKAGKLIRFGCGAHRRAAISPITNRPLLAGDGFGPVSPQVPERLKAPWEPSGAEQPYNEGPGAQAPMIQRVWLRNSRFSRKLRSGTILRHHGADVGAMNGGAMQADGGQRCG